MEEVLRWFPNKLDLEIPNPGSVTPIMGEKRISLLYLSDIQDGAVGVLFL